MIRAPGVSALSGPSNPQTSPFLRVRAAALVDQRRISKLSRSDCITRILVRCALGKGREFQRVHPRE